ncbi:hypothetical protein Tco_0887643 [Tanacetum coccineum]
MTRSSTKELITPFENSKSAFRLKKRLYDTPGLVESSSPELDLFSDIQKHSNTEIMTETMEQYMSKTRGNYGSGVIRSKINDKAHFELKGQYLKELHENTFSSSGHEDANKHIEKVLEVVELFHISEVTQDQVMLRVFPMSLTRAASRWPRNEPSARSTETSDGLTAIQAQLNNLGKEIKKVNEKVYAAQFGAPFQPAGQYRAAGPGFYQHNNINSLYPDRRQTLEESLIKFITGLYVVSGSQHRSRFSEIVPFPMRLQDYCYDNWKEAQDVKILEAYDHTLP